MIDTKSMRERLLREFGLEGATEAEQARLLEGISENLMEALLLAVVRKLPEGNKPDFIDAVEKGDERRIEKLMRAHIPDTDSFLQEEIRKEIAALKALQQKNLGG